MSDEPALLAAILAHPDEDTPRLMYADWLQENGEEERAEFIRLQIKPKNDFTDEDDNRLDELLQRNSSMWTVHLPKDSSERWEWHFLRGMPEELRCDAPAFFEHTCELSEAHIRELVLSDASAGWLLKLAQTPWPKSVVSLVLQECPKAPWFVYGYDCTSAIVAIVNSPQMRQLQTLRFQMYDLTEGAVSAIVNSPHLTQLKTLVVLPDLTPQAERLLRERFGSRLDYRDPWP